MIFSIVPQFSRFVNGKAVKPQPKKILHAAGKALAFENIL